MSPGAPPIVYNHNEGRGIFNVVRGDQQFTTTLVMNLMAPAMSSVDGEAVPVMEPYGHAITYLQDIFVLLDHLPRTSSVVSLRDEVRGFLPVVACVAKTTEIIRDTCPQLLAHAFFADMENQAFKYTEGLEEMKVDITRFASDLGKRMESTLWREILLLIFSRRRWTPLCQRVKRYIQSNRSSLEHFLYFFSARLVREKYRELGNLIQSAGLGSIPPIHQPEIRTIWVRAPVGTDIYAIPLDLCTSWKDFKLVIHRYCDDGPGGEYIQRNDWAMVELAANNIINKSGVLRKFLKPGMRFDVGIIIKLPPALKWRTCPLRRMSSSKGCDKSFLSVFSMSASKRPDLSAENFQNSSGYDIGQPSRASPRSRRDAEMYPRTKFNRTLALNRRWPSWFIDVIGI
ncbi:hypothetical protein PC9H_010800 [Pleurotus ostreatus]|uniref:Ubiquitin-like domain-containing protein n=1 Tax=Pleurotus ostreatus TaxID=5322 RepID=A0A8H6ZMR6_PLEOS|nr:uncharacterized protein PC9H_010800 [Pleurotus ostreatus]KAF7422644.1 hypothetical protein PC9H_010800 [Pleurotus ostreatus]